MLNIFLNDEKNMARSEKPVDLQLIANLNRFLRMHDKLLLRLKQPKEGAFRNRGQAFTDKSEKSPFCP